MKQQTSRAALSVRVFSFYLFGLGGVLVFAPNSLLGLFGLPMTTEVWIRVVGMLAALLGYYYLRASQHELTEFMRATVHGRLGVICCFGGFVAAGLAPPILIAFGAIDAAAALWTAWALHRGTLSGH